MTGNNKKSNAVNSTKMCNIVFPRKTYYSNICFIYNLRVIHNKIRTSKKVKWDDFLFHIDSDQWFFVKFQILLF